jgi:uncharacterized protein (DUF1800 family)
MLEATAIIENDNCLVSSTSRIDAVMQTVSQIPFQQPLYWHNSYVVALLVNRYISVRDVAARLEALQPPLFRTYPFPPGHLITLEIHPAMSFSWLIYHTNA